ncbi:MAG: TIGR03435 family protein [Edaphobacter sp.]
MTVAASQIRSDALLQLLFMVCLTVFAVPVACYAGQAAIETSNPQPKVYEVASIRPSSPDPSDSAITNIIGDRFVASNLSVRIMVNIAYHISTPDYISNVPEWTNNARFDIQAKLEDDPAHQTELQREPVILRALLADRFQFKSHYEKLDRHVYALVVDKHGPKVKEAAAGEGHQMNIRHGLIHLSAAPMTLLIQGLSTMTKHPVVDKTGLTGRYDIDIEWAPDELEGTNDAGPSIFTVLREKLGLKLVPIKAQVDVLVVDHIEKPSPN